MWKALFQKRRTSHNTPKTFHSYRAEEHGEEARHPS
jgi:hypothetical protein